MGNYEIYDIEQLIKLNSYVGRGIILGKSENGRYAVTAYFIMGRSENSRNRIFVESGDFVRILPFEEYKVSDPSLVIYSPVKKTGDTLIVTNGSQTDNIFSFIQSGKTFEEALDLCQFEPDAPNFTPRISGIIYNESKGDFKYKLSILKSGDANGSVCNRFTFSYTPLSGLGHFIHTYNCDGNPLPTFTGEPERVLIPNDIDEFVNSLWTNLDEQNKISLYVRYFDTQKGCARTRLINKNK
ncbi:MAG: IMP cyclohydrolase [Firmicutes bacterium ADurb.Bin300]|nr:MAG: IMP cyclohydrolase [Firmicutes bacterium ADurb.Bin300]